MKKRMDYIGELNISENENQQLKKEQCIRDKQNNYAEQAKILFVKWLKQNKIRFHRITCFVKSEKLLEVCVYFKNDEIWQMHLNDGTICKMREEYLHVLKKTQFFEEFVDCRVNFECDSEENQHRTYGKYGKEQAKFRDGE